jgi:hypothetical protein
MKTLTIPHAGTNPDPATTGNTRRRKIAAGLIYEAFVALGGYSYHRTAGAAEKAAAVRASKLARNAGCPDNPPCWEVAKLELGPPESYAAGSRD